MRWFNERFIAAAFERCRYGESTKRVPMKEVFNAGFEEGVNAERAACANIAGSSNCAEDIRDDIAHRG